MIRRPPSSPFFPSPPLFRSLWARRSWGHWWVWDEPVLVSFLIVFLLYCCYQPLRFSIEDPEKQARYASVFAIAAGAFVPINFMAVRLAPAHVHPRVPSKTGGKPPREMTHTFPVARAGLALPEGRAASVLRELVGHVDVHEAVAISTCNRTEVYLVVSDAVEAESATLAILARQAGIPPTELLGTIYALRDAEAVRHLFQVAAGLDSMIV